MPELITNIFQTYSAELARLKTENPAAYSIFEQRPIGARTLINKDIISFENLAAALIKNPAGIAKILELVGVAISSASMPISNLSTLKKLRATNNLIDALESKKIPFFMLEDLATNLPNLTSVMNGTNTNWLAKHSKDHQHYEIGAIAGSLGSADAVIKIQGKQPLPTAVADTMHKLIGMEAALLPATNKLAKDTAITARQEVRDNWAKHIKDQAENKNPTI